MRYYHRIIFRMRRENRLWREFRKMCWVWAMVIYSFWLGVPSTMFHLLRMLFWVIISLRMIAMKVIQGSFSWMYRWRGLRIVWSRLSIWKIIISMRLWARRLWRIWILKMLWKHSKWAKIWPWFWQFSLLSTKINETFLSDILPWF